MKLTIRKIMAIVLIGVFSQFSIADNASAIKEIADIVASLNHFPSDGDKARLAEIAADESLAAPLREMATTVANINHAPNAEGKAAMTALAANEQAPDRGRTLANIIANLSHVPSAEAKATIAELFP